MSIHSQNKQLIGSLRAGLRAAEPQALRHIARQIFAPNAKLRLGHPIGELVGPDALVNDAYQPLINAMPDIERNDFIVMAGPRWGEGNSGNWVGVGGHFIGTFSAPWLGIRPNGKPVFMRYHEFYRIEAGKVVEMEALWDIPQLMLPSANHRLPSPYAVDNGLRLRFFDADFECL